MPDNTTTHPSAIETPFSDIEDIVADIRDGKTTTKTARTRAT
jgi:hypothetical protein